MKYTTKIKRGDRGRISKIGGFKMTRWEYRNEYLKSPEWQALRESFLEWHNGLCERCKKPGCDVHHIAYKFKETEWEQKQRLMLLCRSCHNTVHKAIDCKLLRFPHHKEDVIALTDEALKKRLSRSKKKELVPMMLISNIVKNGTSHGICLACAKLKITHSTFCSIPANLKATQEQIDYLRWVEKTRPTKDGWKYKNNKKQTKKSAKEKEKLRKLNISLGLRSANVQEDLCPF
jgi:hypothetical protein